MKLVVDWLSSGYLLAIYWLSIGYLLAIYWLSIGYLVAVSRVYIGYCSSRLDSLGSLGLSKKHQSPSLY